VSCRKQTPDLPVGRRLSRRHDARGTPRPRHAAADWLQPGSTAETGRGAVQQPSSRRSAATDPNLRLRGPPLEYVRRWRAGSRRCIRRSIRAASGPLRSGQPLSATLTSLRQHRQAWRYAGCGHPGCPYCWRAASGWRWRCFCLRCWPPATRDGARHWRRPRPQSSLMSSRLPVPRSATSVGPRALG
jgi:hypothetical protein